MPTKKKRRITRKVSPRRSAKNKLYGMDHDFIIISGGGLVVIILIAILLF